MANSILQNKKECFVCHTTRGLHRHHVLYGSRRHIAEEFGLTVFLCERHHTGKDGVHFDPDLDRDLKQYAQTSFIEEYGEELWWQRVGKSYL